MRLTYRDNTVPHTNAKGELWEAYSDANYNEVINKLAAYEDAEEQGRLVIPRWIPVTERLPEDGVKVVALAENGDVRDCDCLKSYVTRYGNYGNKTHWMPLPQPPKEVEK